MERNLGDVCRLTGRPRWPAWPLYHASRRREDSLAIRPAKFVLWPISDRPLFGTIGRKADVPFALSPYKQIRQRLGNRQRIVQRIEHSELPHISDDGCTARALQPQALGAAI